LNDQIDVRSVLSQRAYVPRNIEKDPAFGISRHVEFAVRPVADREAVEVRRDVVDVVLKRIRKAQVRGVAEEYIARCAVAGVERKGEIPVPEVDEAEHGRNADEQ
jgi:hypothetical protein